MKHALIVAEFLSTPWAILPERLSAIAGVVMRLADGEQASAEVMEMVAADAATMAARRSEAQRTAGGGIAVLPFYGVSTQRPPPAMASGSGLMSTQQFASGLRAAVADDSVAGILIDIDSPGGSVFGVQELSNEIYQARGQKPVIAIANSLAASAAYWIGSSASELYVTPGGEVGSIGVFAAHQNRAPALEKEGVETTLISAGKYKVEGSPFGPLSDEAKAYMQTRIDAHYGAFTRDVARNLGTNVDAVRSGMGEGRTLGASAAKAAGMVNGVMTFDQVLQKMARDISAGKSNSNARSGSRVAAMRRDIDILSA
jgi:signal peptide peptidase SppA